MNYVRVDPKRRSVLAGGGALLGAVDHATHAFGLAVPSGIFSTTGVAGLTLGGGLGHLTRQYGLTIDNLLAVDIVLADGSFVTANSKEHPDLFWAVRGGGGNFGVVTSFLFKAHPIHTDYAGPMLWHLEDAAEMMRWYRGFIPKAPSALKRLFRFPNSSARATVSRTSAQQEDVRHCVVLHWAAQVGGVGSLNRSEQLRTPALDLVGPIPHPVLQSMFDALYPPGLQWYWKADFMRELNDEAIAQHIKYAAQLPTMLSTMHLYPIDGKAGRIKNSDTPWCYRDAEMGPGDGRR